MAKRAMSQKEVRKTIPELKHNIFHLSIKDKNHISTMKKILIILAMVAISTGAFAQKSKARTAYMDMQAGKLEDAIENIEIAIEDPAVQGDVKVWQWRGEIYQRAYQTRAATPKLAENALERAFESYKKVLELDDKGKMKDEVIAAYDWLRVSYAGEGDLFRQKSDYKASYDAYVKSNELNAELQKLLGEDKVPMDTIVVFLRAFSADQLEMDDEAINLYERLVAMRYSSLEIPLLYQAASRIHVNREKFEDALRVLTVGQEIYPSNTDLLIDELNIYLATDRSAEAVDRFQKAVELDPTNADLYFALGTIYDKMRDAELAMDKVDQQKADQYWNNTITAYKNAIRVKPDHWNANYNLGALYYNNALEISKQKEDLPISAKEEYKKLEEKEKAMYHDAVIYLEKANQLNDEDLRPLKALKVIYYRLGMTDKYEVVNKKLKQMEG